MVRATPVLAASLLERGAMSLVDRDGTTTLLRPRPERFAAVRDLDSARLEHALADVPHVVRYQHDVATVLTVLRAARLRPRCSSVRSAWPRSSAPLARAC